MLKSGLASLLIIGLIFSASYGQEFEISGQIVDSISGQPIPGVSVENASGKILDRSNDLGIFKLYLPKGRTSIVWAHESYLTEHLSFTLTADTTIYLIMRPIILPEVLVKEKVASAPGDGRTLSMSELTKIPVVLGVVDPLKSLTTLPGVSQGLEGSSYLVVRGGEPDQNLLLFDNLELHHRGHLFGFNSSFNDDMVQSVTLYKNHFPAQYGGRLSSIIQAKSRIADFTHQKTKVSIGLLNSGLYLNTPIQKERTALQLAARTSYAGFLLAPFAGSKDGNESTKPKLYFIESTAKFSHKGKHSVLDIMAQAGLDHYELFTARKPMGESRTKDESTLSNEVFSLAFSVDYGYQFSAYTSLKSTLSQSDFQNRFRRASHFESADALSISRGRDQSHLRVWGWKNRLMQTKDFWSWEFGHQLEFSSFSLQDIQIDLNDFGETQTIDLNPQGVHTLQHAIFAESRIKDDHFNLIGGLRAVQYRLKSLSNYLVEPRAGIEFGRKVKAGLWYSVNHQFIHSLNSINQEVPIDFLLPTSYKIGPQKMQQISLQLSLDKTSTVNTQTWRVAFFHRAYDNLSQLKPGLDFLFNLEDFWEDFLVSGGHGKSTGGEVEYIFQSSLLSSNISYTYNRAERTFPDVNLGRTFVSNFERPHDFKLSVAYRINDQWTMSGYFQVASGLPLSVPSNLTQDGFGDYTPVYLEKNNYRIGTFHHLDLSFSRTWQSHRKSQKILTCGIYNMYGRKNLSHLYYDGYSASGNQVKAKFSGTYLFRYVPSINFQIVW